MTYMIEQEGDSLMVRVAGHIDINSSPVLEDALNSRLEGIRSLTIDLAQVDYISSMGLRLLLALQKRMSKQGSMLVTNAGGAVLELFEETGFSDILTLA